MSGSTLVTPYDLSLVNFNLCEDRSTPVGITRPSALHLLSTQLNDQLQDKTQYFRASFAIYWLIDKKPFESLNYATAVVVGLALLDSEPNKELLTAVLNTVKTNFSINSLQTVLMNL